jgi:hypothetical protein
MTLGDFKNHVARALAEGGRRWVPRLPPQASRLLVLLGLAGLALAAARTFLTPATFGDIGHYRAAAITDEQARPIKYAGRFACAECHDDVVAVHAVARHQTVACEACHDALAGHLEAPDEVRPRIPRERDFCPRCHGFDASRPTGFPQVDPTIHNPVDPCVSCHEPHAPEPPLPVASCAACHGEIARVKATSHHAGLVCETCHESPEAHMDTPRLAMPTKPVAREFCGQCHATDATSRPEIPRVDLSSHGGRYVCWQCHYPHYPEVS